MPEQSHGPKECGSCRWWRPILEDQRGPIGPCRLGVRGGDFPGTAPTCERYLARDEAIPSAAQQMTQRRRAAVARPVVIRRAEGASEPTDQAGTVPSNRPFIGGRISTLALPEEMTDMTPDEFAQAIRQVLREEASEVPLAPRWEGGTVILKPGDPQSQPKEIPLDGLFHKVVMIRDRLRVLEQKINAHPKLSDVEKVEMEQYITKCYGTLTTFNVLFREEKDRFVGEKG